MVYTEKMKQACERYRNKHREEIKERDRHSYNENPEKYRQKSNLYRKTNKKIVLKRKKEIYQEVKLKGKCVNCGSRRDNPRSKCFCLRCMKMINEKNRKTHVIKRQIWKEKNLCRNCGDSLAKGSNYYCVSCREINRKHGKHYGNSDKGINQRRLYHHIAKFRALQIVSRKIIPCCDNCGISDLRILTINHNNGKLKIDEQFRNKNRNIYKTPYYQIINGMRKTDDLSVLCYNCNILYEYIGRKRIGKVELKEIEKKLKENKIIPESYSLKGDGEMVIQRKDVAESEVFGTEESLAKISLELLDPKDSKLLTVSDIR